MSFSGKSFWMPRDAGCLDDGEMGYDNSSRIEPKRGHQWFMDTTGPELFSNKKQAIEAVSNGPVLGSSHLNASPWHNTSSFQSVSGQFSERLFGSETVQTVNVVDRHVPRVSGGDMNMGRKDINDIYGDNSTMGLSASHGIEDTSRSISFGGIRKIKVNQVRVASMDISSSSGESYSRGDGSAISLGTYNKTDGSNIYLGPTNDNRGNNAISVGPNFSKTDGSFISMGQAFNKGDGNFMLMGHNYTKGSQTILAMSPPFDKMDANFITIGPSCGKGDSNAISMSSSYDKGHEDYITMPPNYNKANENFISMANSYSKEDHNSISVALTYDKVEPNIASIDSAQDKGDSNIITVGSNYKSDGNNMSFGGFHDESETDAAGHIISSYDMLMSDQNSTQTSEVPIRKDSVEPSANQVVNNTQRASLKTDNVSKGKVPKPSKKVPSNNFPSNVKSLLSTGMLDGVPVKYVSWSREKNLKGTIKGTGYLCGCNECNFAKALNAYEFERHASCKTKHPNNHIYFQNGKTIYAVVQELKTTPQEMLFDAIQNVTGSQINQKNFHIWKVSYQAATRELQRIYGKDEGVMPS